MPSWMVIAAGAAPLDPESKTLFVKDTIDFSIKYNPLFHARPEWLVKATCISAYAFWIVYAAIFFVSYFDAWGKSSLLTRVFIPVGIGIKLNAIFFYHFMEFMYKSEFYHHDLTWHDF